MKSVKWLKEKTGSALLSCMALCMIMTGPAQAASYTVGSGGDYDTLKSIIESGVLDAQDEIVLLSNDETLNANHFPDGMGLPVGLTIRSASGVYEIRQLDDHTGDQTGMFYFGEGNGRIILQDVAIADSSSHNLTGGALSAGGNIDLSGSSNINLHDNAGVGIAAGGIVRMDDASDITLQRNTSGAINASGVRMDNVKNSNVTFNSALEGGGIRSGVDGAILSNFNNVLFQNNSASQTGGAAHSDGSFELIDANGVTFKSNNSRSGGAVAANSVNIIDSYNIVFDANNGIASADGFGGYGGAIFAMNEAGTGEFNMSASDYIRFCDNTATGNPNGPAANAYGGAIAADAVRFNDNTDVEFTDNIATSPLTNLDGGSVYGGAIYANEVEITGSGDYTFAGNKVIGGSTSWGVSGEAQGGAIYGSMINLEGDASYVFSNNVASAGGSGWDDPAYFAEGQGGAIYAAQNEAGEGFLLVDNARFAANQAYSQNAFNVTGGWGGAIFTEVDATISNSEIVGNTASGFGGGIASVSELDNLATVKLHNTIVTGNEAGVSGGGMYTNGHVELSADAGNLTLIAGNSSETNGSDGIYIDTNSNGDTSSNRTMNVYGEGTVEILDSVRAVGENSVNMNKTDSGDLIWGNYNYFSNNSSMNFETGSSTLMNNFHMEAQGLDLDLGAEHSLYFDLNNRDREFAFWTDLENINVELGAQIILLYDDPEIAGCAMLGRWLISEQASEQWLNLEIADLYTLVNGEVYYGAFFELDPDNSLWINLGQICPVAATPIPASAGILGIGLMGLIRIKRRFSK